MSLSGIDVLVSYPSDAVSGTGTVVHIEPLDDGSTSVLLDATPCHPVDAGWPDDYISTRQLHAIFQGQSQSV
jgi:alanyl-tRNA synthetase